MKQAIAVTWINLQSIPRRLGATLVMVVGIAGVVGVLSAMLTLTQGLAGTLMNSSSPLRAVMLSEGAHFIGVSSLSPEHIQVTETAPGVARLADEKPAVARDVRVSVTLVGKEDGIRKGVVIRGLSPSFFEMRTDVQLTGGRMFRLGLNEAIIGEQAQRQFAGTDIGDTIDVTGHPLQIVGTFTSGGDWYESGFMMDAQTLNAARKTTSVHSLIIWLESEAAFTELNDHVMAHPTLKFQALREPDYYQRLDDAWSTMRRLLMIVGSIMAVGGLFCAFNVMYSAVSAREVEIATYKALGFGASGILVSVVVESVVVGGLGALLGTGVTWLLFQGNTVTTGGWDASVVHTMDVSLWVLVQGLVAAVGIAVLGAIIPAWRAVRLPVTEALRH
jgi:putative ABC transport system permease protein